MARALSTIDNFVDVNVDSVGTMCIQCPKCLAFCFKKEKTTICCYNGKIASEHVSHPVVHPMLNELFMENTPESRRFLKSIRKYNQAFAFMSMHSKFQSSEVTSRGGLHFPCKRRVMPSYWKFRARSKSWHKISTNLFFG